MDRDSLDEDLLDEALLDKAEPVSAGRAGADPCIEPHGRHATIDQRIWLTVSAIPAGCIATYGDVAERAGMPGAARRVGAALRRLPPDSTVPWHRVVNANGRSSLPPGGQGADHQRARLAEDGVLLGRSGRAVLRRYRWT